MDISFYLSEIDTQDCSDCNILHPPTKDDRSSSSESSPAFGIVIIFILAIPIGM